MWIFQDLYQSLTGALKRFTQSDVKQKTLKRLQKLFKDARSLFQKNPLDFSSIPSKIDIETQKDIFRKEEKTVQGPPKTDSMDQQLKAIQSQMAVVRLTSEKFGILVEAVNEYLKSAKYREYLIFEFTTTHECEEVLIYDQPKNPVPIENLRDYFFYMKNVGIEISTLAGDGATSELLCGESAVKTLNSAVDFQVLHGNKMRIDCFGPARGRYFLK